MDRHGKIAFRAAATRIIGLTDRAAFRKQAL